MKQWWCNLLSLYRCVTDVCTILFIYKDIYIYFLDISVDLHLKIDILGKFMP